MEYCQILTEMANIQSNIVIVLSDEVTFLISYHVNCHNILFLGPINLHGACPKRINL